ncbi:MAG TPA: hypothetical protein ENK47_02945 [Euryarchaeota archaeon]|nr:hypothetical protein [Euryarchaeota archaeon]
MRKIKWNGTKVILLLLMIFMLFVSLIFLVIVNGEYWTKEEPSKAKLEVEEAYFKTAGDSSGNTVLEVFIFVTNVGDLSCSSHIRAFAVDKETNIALDDATTDVVTIKGGTTDEASFMIEVPSSRSYRVEFLIFKDERITVKGEGSVDLRVAGSGGMDYFSKVTDTTPQEEKESAAIPFIGPGAIIASAAVALLLIRRWRR